MTTSGNSRGWLEGGYTPITSYSSYLVGRPWSNNLMYRRGKRNQLGVKRPSSSSGWLWDQAGFPNHSVMEIGGTILYIVGCLTTSLAYTHWIWLASPHPHICGNQICLEMSPNISCGDALDISIRTLLIHGSHSTNTRYNLFLFYCHRNT